MKGVILAGGNGTRLRPLTLVANKHLLPVYDKPMILYPLDTLKQMGIDDVLLISGGEHIGTFMEFLGDGKEYGVNLTYRIQREAGGIAQALSLAEDFVGSSQFAVILGDNIFEKAPEVPTGCGIVLKEVENPSRFGVYQDNKIVEKPENPTSKLAVTGLYFYTPEIFKFVKGLTPSARGELEITDVNNWCLENLDMQHHVYKDFWSDAGTFESLLLSSNWAKETEKGRVKWDVLRTGEIWEKYKDVRDSSQEQLVERIEKAETIERYDYWRLIANDFPYGKVAETHLLLFPIRLFTNDSEMDGDERAELTAIKKKLTDKYKIDVFAENSSLRRSILGWYHLHLIKWKGVR